MVQHHYYVPSTLVGLQTPDSVLLKAGRGRLVLELPSGTLS